VKLLGDIFCSSQHVAVSVHALLPISANASRTNTPHSLCRCSVYCTVVLQSVTETLYAVSTDCSTGTQYSSAVEQYRRTGKVGHTIVKVAVANLKGGTGKTVSAFFLSAALSRYGRTLLVDCDPQGSTLSWAEGAEENGAQLTFSVMGLPVKDVHRKLKGFENDYEHIVLDTPPGEITITRSALLAADTALLPVPPTAIDLDRVMPTLELIAEVEPLNDLRFRLLLTRVRRISREGRDARVAMEEMGLPVMDTEVPQLSFYSDAFGEPIADDLGEYAQVATELLPTKVEV
jgi:chromosome partitioning protein